MKKIIQVGIPFIAAFLMLGIMFDLQGGPYKTAALSSSFTGAAIIVTSLEDEINADGDCSLREALTAANNNIAVDACLSGDAIITDTITFEAVGTIMVTSQLSVTAGGPILIDGGEAITTSGSGTTRVWWVETGSELTLQDLVVADGYVSNNNGAGIYNNGGSLTINQCEFVGNRFTISDSVHYYGGAIYSTAGFLNVHDSLFEDNGSGDKYSHGGGIAAIYTTGQILRTTFRYNKSAGCWQGIPCSSPGGGGIYLRLASITIQSSKFISNSALYGGGGIASEGGYLTIANSTFSSNSGGLGGGMLNSGDMIINNSTFSGNSGGGIYSWGDMTISDTTFLENEGAGIFNMGTITITDSTFSENQDSGIYNNGTMSVANSTFSGNSARNGAGINNLEYIRAQSLYTNITNCTFTGNTATEFGGGVYNGNLELSITNSTFFANSAGVGGGGIYNDQPFSPPYTVPLTLTNTIVSNSLLGGDCAGNYPISEGGHNLDSDNTCGLDPLKGSLPNTDPMLGPLQDNGGRTWTHALLWGSPAIDAGYETQCPPTDQRGVPRPLDGNGDRTKTCDIGSFEFPTIYLREVFLTQVINFP